MRVRVSPYNFIDASAYQRSVANNSFRFFNCETHYKPVDINILLREIPAEPVARRFFFTALVACRRRLAKRWEQTPLAKLFTLQVTSGVKSSRETMRNG